MNSILNKLKKHQRELIEHIETNIKIVDRIFIYHSLGSGKTITGISLGYLYKVQTKNTDKITIITPLSIINNFYKEIKFLGLKEEDFEILSYGKLFSILKKDSMYLKNKIVICDEIHNYRNDTRTTRILIKSLNGASRVIIMSATPMINSVIDFSSIIAILNKTNYSSGEKSLYNLENLKNKISCYNVPTDELEIHYPKTNIHYIKLEMTQKYYIDYMYMETEQTAKLPKNFKEKDYTVFLNGLRRSTNKLFELSPKFEWIVNKYTSNPQKTLIYSFWKDSGIYQLQELFAKKKIRTEVIDGTLPLKKRTEIVNSYNNNEFDILLISSAGGEGLDLKETRNVIVLEPHWNNEKLKQVIGRAVRYNSHTKLSESKRNVNVYFLILIKPKLRYIDYLNITRLLETNSIDEKMLLMSKSKDERINEYIKNIKKVCI